jgi:hypothetical protein
MSATLAFLRAKAASSTRLSGPSRLSSCLAFSCFVAMGLPLNAAAQGPDSLPLAVRRGLDLIASDSTPKAISVWAASWTGPAFEGRFEELSEGFRRLEAIAGRAHGYDVLAVDSIGPNLLRVFLVLRYERLPVFMELVAYNPRAPSSDTWIVPSVRFHTAAPEVLPLNIWPR